jgi:hypothetical protein
MRLLLLIILLSCSCSIPPYPEPALSKPVGSIACDEWEGSMRRCYDREYNVVCYNYASPYKAGLSCLQVSE